MIAPELDFTPASYELPGVIESRRSWSDRSRYGDVQIQLDWDARLKLVGPRTFTHDEFEGLIERFAEEHLRSKCMRIVLAMPEEILPFVCPQLEEMVNYEWTMLLDRQAQIKPAIREKWGALPPPA